MGISYVSVAIFSFFLSGKTLHPRCALVTVVQTGALPITDRAINHMSNAFQEVMKDISRTLKQVYNAHCAIVVPGSGTFGMEAVARQFATNKQCLVIRNGWFSYRWRQIFAMGGIPSGTTVLNARPVQDGRPAERGRESCRERGGLCGWLCGVPVHS